MNNIKKFLNKELIIYIICGGVTTFSNIIIYWCLTSIQVEYKIANIIANIISIIIAYILNKKLVFCTKCENINALFKEVYMFASTRGLTFLIDYFGLIFMIEIFNFHNLISKIFMTVLVIILNYIIGKKFVFNQNGGEENVT